MKRFLFFFIICISTSTIGLAQTTVYHPFPDSNAFWQVRHWNVFTSATLDQTRYGLKGDTVISGKTYHQVFSLFDSTLTNPRSTYYAAIREENKRVYGVISDSVEHLLYDFNISVGDTERYDYLYTNGGPSTFYRVLTSIDSVLLGDGKYRKRFNLSSNSQASFDIVIEGLGSTLGHAIFEPIIDFMCTCEDVYEVSCIKEYDTALYLNNPLCNQCFCSFLTSVNDYKKQNTFQIYPNPTSDQFYIEANTTDKLTVDLFDMKGRRVLNAIVSDKSNINVTTLPNGIYTLTIKSADRVTNQKLVIVR